jgi:hypothetical protein
LVQADHSAGKYGRIMEVAALYMDRILTKVMIEISFIYIRVQNLQIDGFPIASAGGGVIRRITPKILNHSSNSVILVFRSWKDIVYQVQFPQT